MECPVCGSDSCEIIKSKGKNTKQLLLKCNDCGNTFRETIILPKKVECRVIISRYEDSEKKHMEIYSDEVLHTGDVLDVDDEHVEITSLENKRGGRVNKSKVSDLVTIWASSLVGPARVGISVDFGGNILSKKVEVDRNFLFTVGDVVKMEGIIFRVKSMKTQESKMRKGSSRAEYTKRVYGKPLDRIERINYDLTSKIISNEV